MGYVQTLSIAPVARGQGIGHELLRAVRARLAGIGVARIELTAVAPNEPARRFYEREGFGVVFVTMAAQTEPAGSDLTTVDER